MACELRQAAAPSWHTSVAQTALSVRVSAGECPVGGVGGPGLGVAPGVGGGYGGYGGGVGGAAAASAGYESAGGFANKAAGQEAGQGSFAYNLGGSDKKVFGHSSSYGDSKSFGLSESEGFNRGEGQASHGSAFGKEAAGSGSTSHSSGKEVVVG
ncbi:hypothetical protein HPB49_019469 [Dermacentor silvarum]|uniref:Uncharacterized protein n=1 Tax=Dermacentor silvarum TaxID=543639 RepID=A0ACB8E2P5_DERSI|nr:hypothetical protein HPB49_019469 [Dermacentor silvarum]